MQAEEFTFFDRYFLRMQSFTKYANVTAVVLGCGYFASLSPSDAYHGKALTYASSSLLIAMYLTISKAAIPLFLIIGTALVIILRDFAQK